MNGGNSLYSVVSLRLLVTVYSPTWNELLDSTIFFSISTTRVWNVENVCLWGYSGKHNQTVRYNKPYWWSTEKEFSRLRWLSVLQVELLPLLPIKCAHAFTHFEMYVYSHSAYDPVSVAAWVKHNADIRHHIASEQSRSAFLRRLVYIVKQFCTVHPI